MSQSWGRPASASGDGWVVVDVETSGFRPGHARIISLAALALDAQGNVEHSVVSLLNPGVDPGPTHVHGLTAEMLEDQPTFAEIADEVIELLHGRTLVAHNVAFDYAFLTTEAELAGTALPIDTVMCTVELARRLKLGLDNLRLETLARHWDISQTRAHDAFDDALVLSRVLSPALQRAREHDIWLPVRPVTRRRWPNGRVT
ncbi:MAG TPA: exonuclease domain-containing protein, partial [Mycobacterium sp.]|nr:exonuclease domain-containing protein [Mycobacterium sp.]